MRGTHLTSLLAFALIGLLSLPVGVLAQQKTAKQCNDEYAANKAAIQASGKKKTDFIKECRAGQSATDASQSAAPPTATAPPAAPKTTTKSPPAASTAPSTSATAKSNQGTTASAAGQFSTESQARAHCPGDTVVWANLNSKIYHFVNSKDYGNTKNGAYMCERDTANAGIRVAKNEKHP